MPKFSIIIPVYKVEKYVRQCIESVLNQYLQDFEAIIVDDCGQDSSMNIIEEYAKTDSRIKIYRHKHNMGLAEARNTGLKHAKGQYIVCLDSDDWMEPNCLTAISNIFNNYETNSVWFNARKYFENSKIFENRPMYSQCEGYRILTPDNIAAYADFTWIKAYTRESIQKYNLRWPKGLTFEDGEFYFKYFTHNPKTYVIEDCLINYRYRDDSIVRQADKGNIKIDDIYTVLRHLKTFWTKLGVYNRYKITMLKLLQNRLRMCYGLNYSDNNKKLSYKIIKDLNYPDDFIECKQTKQEHNPLVTVVVPYYNVEKYVNECLDSILCQTYNNLEILCIDDCGQDNSSDIVKKYSKKDKRIKIIKHNKNKGLGAARNTGLKKASGKYIFFIDSDDMITPNCINTVVRKMQATNLNTVFFKADVLWENTKQRTPIWYTNYKDFEEGNFIINENNMCYLPHYSWNKGYNKDFLLKNKIFWQEGVIYEDMEFFFKLFIKSPNTYMIDEPLYIYRRRDNSLIGQCYNNSANAADLFKVTKSIYNYLKSNNLLNRYKQSFLHLLCNNINNYRGFGIVYQNNIHNMLDCLKDINFPSEYEYERTSNA